MFENLIYSAKVIRTKFISDKQYLTKRFIKKLGYKPNLRQPKTFNEKVTARMIFERNALHTQLADKFKVRELIADKIDNEHLVPILGIYKNFEEINFDQLPNKFVLKCNHDSGSAIVCYDKKNFDIAKAQCKLKKHLSQNMYFNKREWHYKNISPIIIVEQYVDLIHDPIKKLTLSTCRVHCFEGKVHFIEVDVHDEQNIEYSNMYDPTWSLQPFTVDKKNNTPIDLDKPERLSKIIELSEKLSFKEGYSRVDFLITKEQIYFSEITLTPNAGRMVITPSEWDEKLGALWQ